MTDPGAVDPRIAELFDEIAFLVDRNHQLLRELDECRQRRILATGQDGDGPCLLCFTGRYETVSVHTWLAARHRDGALIRIDHVPVIECSICGHALLTMDDAHRLDQLFDRAEQANAEPAPVVHLDWLDRHHR